MIIEEEIYKTKLLDKYKKYFKFLNNYEESVDVHEVLPQSIRKNFEDDMLDLKSKISLLDKEYKFIEKLKHVYGFMNNLECAKINSITYKSFLEVEKNESIRNTLRTFKPIRGNSKNVKYSAISNVTGRIIVKEGPSILTLPKKYRSILNSRFENGHIISIDFSSLEPRLCLKLSNKETSKDLYEEINEMLELNLNRSVIKRAIISVLYGAHYTSLKDISEVKSKALFECIREYFDLNNILKMSKNIDEHGIRRNTEGRPLWNLDEEKENILINNFIQSSAVDIALGYFSNLSNLINKEESVILFVLHDAVILDVKDSYLNSIKEIAEKGYDHPTLGNFPLKLETFNNISRINNEY